MAATPRCLILFGDGCLLNETTLESIDCPALDQTAREGCTGQLALRKLPDGVTEAQRSLLELEQILDLESNKESGGSSGQAQSREGRTFVSLNERFMGMSASFFSSSQSVKALASKAGFDSQLLTENQGGLDAGMLPDAASFAEQSLTLLGLATASERSAGSNVFNELTGSERGSGDPAKSQDLVFVHLRPDVSEDSNGAQPSNRTDDAPSPSKSDQDLVESAKASLVWLDALVAAIRKLESRDSRIAARLYLVLVLSYHATAVTESGTSRESEAEPKSDKVLESAGAPEGLLAFKPVQSYQQKEGQELTNIRESHHALVVYNSHGLTRRDAVQSLQASEITTKSGNLTILADRFFHEVAFKVGRAPKYGA
ncbi:hypothetical protein KFL_002220110 [Klebsormidium nitens]|uniref:Uncharacterized protein n=1 Tax=Klebsormidium nitens TaxID=105231 RepID=A0A1Y1I8Y8_KLENI|nr:hypothetical protein KFL_002220110 [Klebsormidium nitens]|eukprot:GAQ85167.1 hypothetical protein KFL_002220110 [Klebsormidium nitens]